VAQHEVNFVVPSRPLGNADIRFVVNRDDDKLGELHISKGAVVWIGKDRKFGRRLSWTKLAEVFEANGTKRRP
jgi:hypothetical protein